MKPSGELGDVMVFLCEPFATDENRNDRRVFDPDELEALAASINQTGLIHPPHVERKADGSGYWIIAGERRTRAVKLLGWETMPAFVHDPLTPAERRRVMAAENTGRTQLNAIEEAGQFDRMIRLDGLTSREVGERVGKSSRYVSIAVKLLALRPEIQNLVVSGDMERGYALVLADYNLDPNRQMIAARTLRDWPAPTPGWFRGICSELAEQQASSSLFDLPMFGGDLEAYTPHISAAAYVAPALPGVDKPPTKGRAGRGPRAILTSQIKYWLQAADEWAKLGKLTEEAKCKAAAFALESAIECLPHDPIMTLDLSDRKRVRP